MLRNCPCRRLRAALAGLLVAAALWGCASAEYQTYSTPCGSPLAATGTSYCNPYLERGGRS
jgi:hypothetical protein